MCITHLKSIRVTIYTDIYHCFHCQIQTDLRVFLYDSDNLVSSIFFGELDDFMTFNLDLLVPRSNPGLIFEFLGTNEEDGLHRACEHVHQILDFLRQKRCQLVVRMPWIGFNKFVCIDFFPGFDANGLEGTIPHIPCQPKCLVFTQCIIDDYRALERLAHRSTLYWLQSPSATYKTLILLGNETTISNCKCSPGVPPCDKVSCTQHDLVISQFDLKHQVNVEVFAFCEGLGEVAIFVDKADFHESLGELRMRCLWFR